MKTRDFGRQVLLGVIFGASLSVLACGQGPRNLGNWSMPGNGAGQAGFQQAEAKLNSQDAANQFKFLWKLQLGDPSGADDSFNEPLLRQRLINSRGFKDLVLWADSSTLYAVDNELGRIDWQKHFETTDSRANGACGPSRLQIVMEQPPTINFNARPRPGTAPPPQPPPVSPGERRLGMKAGGGGFAMQGIYVLTGDGYLHEQVIATGGDFAPAVKFLPASHAGVSGLTVEGNTIVAVAGAHCGGNDGGAWALQMQQGEYPVTHYGPAQLDALNLRGMPMTADGTGYLVTGRDSVGEALHPNSVVALDVKSGLTVKDWYTPAAGFAGIRHVSPVVFSFKGRELAIAPGSDGRVVLLDTASLGGADHHSPLFESTPLSVPGAKHNWDSFAAWTDQKGDTWVIASISAPVTPTGNSGTAHGKTTHGAYAAFRVEGSGDRPTLTPVWISRDMVNPAPPVITNDVVIALAGGDAQTHAVLYVLNSANGDELYSSKDKIESFANLSAVSFGNSHAYFADHNHVLYAFGIEMEH